MAKNAYPSNMTDAEWECIAPFFTKADLYKREGHPPLHDRRIIMDALFYMIKTGCQWRMLPHDFPPWSTVHACFWRWKQNGLFERIHTKLREDVRGLAKRHLTPSAAIIDSQSAKTTEAGGIRGYDAGKKGEWQKATYPG